MPTTRLRRFCLLSRNYCRLLNFRAKIVTSNHYIYPHLLVQSIQFTSIKIMPPKRKIESKKAEKVEVKGNGDTMEVLHNVEISKGRVKRANTMKPDKVVEEMEDVVLVKKGQKKEAAPVEEPKKRGRKLRADKELVPLSASKASSPKTSPKASSPISNKRGRRLNVKAEEETIDVDSDGNDELPVKKVTKKATKVAKEPEAEAPTRGKRGKKPKAVVLAKESSTEEESEEEKVEEKKMIPKKQLKADIVTKDGIEEEKVEEKKRNLKQQKGDEDKNTTETNYENIDFIACEKNPRGEDANMKIACWNIGGIRAWLKKDGMQYITNESPDILCFQETKCSEKKLPEDFVSTLTNGGTGKYHMYWLDGQKDGYAGVAMFTLTKPLSVSYGIENQEMDKESRCITAQFQDYYVINVYVPNSGRGLVTMQKRMEWNEAFRAYVKRLDAEKPVILCGDMNVAHNEIDLKNPKSNKKNAGFTPEEREGMTTFLADGYLDVYRSLYPEEKDCYTFWSYMSNARNKNVGWRLDYFLVSSRFMENICDTKIRSTIFGSDHCPLTLHFNCDV